MMGIKSKSQYLTINENHLDLQQEIISYAVYWYQQSINVLYMT